MPELPEVETVVRGLRPLLVNQVIKHCQVLLPKTLWLDQVRATGRLDLDIAISLIEEKKVLSINRRAKLIIIHLSSDVTLLIHLKMTGQLILVNPLQQRLTGGHPSAEFTGILPAKSTRVILSLSDGSILYFNDMRQFGYIKVIVGSALSENPTYAAYGPEPLGDEFTVEYLWAKAAPSP